MNTEYDDLARYCCVFICLIWILEPYQCNIEVSNKRRIWVKMDIENNKKGDCSLRELGSNIVLRAVTLSI